MMRLSTFGPDWTLAIQAHLAVKDLRLEARPFNDDESQLIGDPAPDSETGDQPFKIS